MNVLVFLIPISLLLGFGGLLAFLWTLRHGQYDDLEGDAERVLLDDETDRNPRSLTVPERAANRI